MVEEVILLAFNLGDLVRFFLAVYVRVETSI